MLHGEHKDLADERDEDDGRASPPPAGDQGAGQTAPDRTRIYTIGPPLPPVGTKSSDIPTFLSSQLDRKLRII